MGYFIAEYKNESWELGKEYHRIDKILEQYKQRVHLCGTSNIKLLMTRSVHVDMTEIKLVHPLAHEKGE